MGEARVGTKERLSEFWSELYPRQAGNERKPNAGNHEKDRVGPTSRSQ
jgi:hypothetical protein